MQSKGTPHFGDNERFDYIAKNPYEQRIFNILNLRNQILVEINEYLEKKSLGCKWHTNKIYSKVNTLYFDVKAELQNDLKVKDVKYISDLIKNLDYDSLVLGFDMINAWLLKKNIIKFGVNKSYDMTDIEADNKHAGLY